MTDQAIINEIQAIRGRNNKNWMDLVRLAMPRRVYTQSHADYVVEVFKEVVRRRERLHGLRIVSQPRQLRHFTARFEPLS